MERHEMFGRIVGEIPRPSPELIKRFRTHDPAKVHDAMGRHGSMDYEIKPIAAGMRVCGPAVTVWTRTADALFVLKASDVARPGDVVVVDAGGVKEFCCFGDRAAWYFRRVGIQGIVIDGGTRDVIGIREVGLPTFARSVTMHLHPSSGPGAINIPIQCGRMPVNPGDLVLGDDDGVVVVPREDCARVLELAEAHLALELERQRRQEAGETYMQTMGYEERVRFWTEAEQADAQKWGRH